MPEKQIIDLINKIIVHRKSSKHHASKDDNITNLNNNSPKNLLNTVTTPLTLFWGRFTILPFPNLSGQ